MDKEQREEVRQLIEDVIGKPLEEIIGRLNILNANTSRIETQTTKTNGRVDKLESCVSDLQKVNLTHTVNCPNTKLLKEIEVAAKDRKENCPYKTEIEILKTERISRASILKFVLGVVAVSGTIVAIMKYFSL